MISKTKKKEKDIKLGSLKGFSLIETIIYVSLLSILISAIAWSVTSIFHSYNKMDDTRQVENSAMLSMDRMVKEIRNSRSVDLSNTATSTPNGYLTLNDFDQEGDPETMKFYLLNDRVYADKNGVQLGPLTLDNVVVSSLVFRYFPNGNSAGIKIELGLKTPSGVVNNFYDSAVLRNSYQD
ncbi:MAG: type II secretion system protein [bacterium]